MVYLVVIRMFPELGEALFVVAKSVSISFCGETVLENCFIFLRFPSKVLVFYTGRWCLTDFSRPCG